VNTRHLKVRVAGIALSAFLLWLIFLAALTVSFSRQRSENPSDVAIVLGAGVDGGKPSPVFAARLDHAIDLHKRGVVRRLILTGGTGEGDTQSESEVGAAYAVRHAIPPDQILTESVSHTTYQNLVQARRLLRSIGMKSALLVSDPLHMRRACVMARDLGIDVEASPTPTSRYQSLGSQVPFLLRELYFHHHYVFFGQ
jgi:uncharacterized SAM-binding protein YcdF (DUF218 family)